MYHPREPERTSWLVIWRNKPWLAQLQKLNTYWTKVMPTSKIIMLSQEMMNTIGILVLDEA